MGISLCHVYNFYSYLMTYMKNFLQLHYSLLIFQLKDDVDYDELALLTEGYSGSGLKEICKFYSQYQRGN